MLRNDCVGCEASVLSSTLWGGVEILHSGYQTKISYGLITSAVRTTCIVHLISPGFGTQILFDEILKPLLLLV